MTVGKYVVIESLENLTGRLPPVGKCRDHDPVGLITVLGPLVTLFAFSCTVVRGRSCSVIPLMETVGRSN